MVDTPIRLAERGVDLPGLLLVLDPREQVSVGARLLHLDAEAFQEVLGLLQCRILGDLADHIHRLVGVVELRVDLCQHHRLAHQLVVSLIYHGGAPSGARAGADWTDRSDSTRSACAAHSAPLRRRLLPDARRLSLREPLGSPAQRQPTGVTSTACRDDRDGDQQRAGGGVAGGPNPGDRRVTAPAGRLLTPSARSARCRG